MPVNERGNGLAITIVGCAIVAFVICYWLFRIDDRSESARQQGQSAQNPISASNASKKPPDNFQVAPTEGESSGLPEAQVLTSSADSVPPSKRIKADNNASPPSITHRYSAPLVRGPETGPAGFERAGELSSADADTSWVQRTETIEVHADSQGCKLCSSSKSRAIAIPRDCAYSYHTLTQLHREPYAPVEKLDDPYTEYLDRLDTDEKGRLEAITLLVRAEKEIVSAVNPSITMQLTVVMECPRSAHAGG